MPDIHPTAEVRAGAELAEGVRIEAGALVEAGCVIGTGTVVGRNSVIWEGTRIGSDNRIFPFCSLGGEPQDKKYQGEETPLVIGDGNTIREYCFINRGTAASGETRIGDRNWVMAYVHFAHDCVLGDDTVIANACQFAGHVSIGDRAVIGGGTLVHQFCRVGRGAIIGGGEKIRMDIPPWVTVARDTVAINREGLRRWGATEAAVRTMQAAHKVLYRSGASVQEATERLRAQEGAAQEPLADWLEFLQLPELRLIRPHEPR